MARRRFLAGIGLFTIGGASGAGAVAAAALLGSEVASEGPTARTAVPTSSGAFAATATFRTAPSAKIVALTIDDGPTREWTPQILQVLRRRGAHATFYRVGEHALAAPDLVTQTAAEGHEQGNHTWAHDDLTQHDELFNLASLRRTHELLTELTGRPPTSCRPPYGRIDSVGIAACASMRYAVILWSQHVTGSNAAGDVDAIVRRPSAGAIVLAHDGGSEPTATLMRQLDRLVATMTDSGYRFVTISELLASAGQAARAESGATAVARRIPPPPLADSDCAVRGDTGGLPPLLRVLPGSFSTSVMQPRGEPRPHGRRSRSAGTAGPFADTAAVMRWRQTIQPERPGPGCPTPLTDGIPGAEAEQCGNEPTQSRR